jgi:hypothetical protein
MNKYKLSVILTLLLVSVSQAQIKQFNLGLDFSLLAPQGEFKKKVDRFGYGLAGNFKYNFAALPFSAGAGFGFGIYGSETREEPFSSTIPDVTVEVQTTNNILFSHLILQFRPFNGMFQPYLEGLYGFNYLFTETSINDVDSEFEEVTSSKNLSDFTSSYGFGIGLMLRLMDDLKLGDENQKRTGQLYLDLSIKSLTGGKAEYLKENSIYREGQAVTYDISRSNTDLITYQIGVVFGF